MDALPTIDITEQTNSSQVTLEGDWGFAWETWLTSDSLNSLQTDLEIISLPNYLTDIIPPSGDSLFTHGISSYAKRIKNLNQGFQRPSISMRDVSEAWEAYWIEPNGSEIFLGGSGKLSIDGSTTEVRDQTYLLDLPRNTQDGVLLIHVSNHHYSRGGLYGGLTIKEQTQNLRDILFDLFSRALLFGIGLYVIVQNLTFFAQRPKDLGLLLLAVFCFVGFARSSISSGYVAYMIPGASWTFTLVKIEYLLVIWPGVSALHYVSYIFPYRQSTSVLLFAYSMFFVFIIGTFVSPISYVTYYLTYYQIVLLACVGMTIAVVARGIGKGMPDSRYFLLSIVPLIIAIMNDIYAARSPNYHFYVAEYALFIFLFLQTQKQATRFITALETSEHLTDNLQSEVDLKTAELSKRNLMLEEKAEQLEQQHHQVKFLSETDHLTGLYNRQTLENYSEILFKLSETYDQPLCLVMMDLDHFKNINDQYGHLVGDECLVFTASFVRGFSFHKRDVVARYGGEEFALVLTNRNLVSAQAFMQEICDGLSRIPVQGNHDDITLTASFGIAERLTSGAQSFHELIESADQALYEAKKRGRNRVEIHSPAQASNRDRITKI